MSYDEYYDLFYKAQEKECPYRAFTFDIVHSKSQEQYIKEHNKFMDLITDVYDELKREEERTGNQILLDDDKNVKPIYAPTFEIKNEEDLNYFKKYSSVHWNGNLLNPMQLGDMITYFVYNNSITTERMIDIFSQELDKKGIDYPFHFNTGVYETNDYGEGGSKMYKGYMPQILEDSSKEINFIVTRETYKQTTENESEME